MRAIHSLALLALTAALLETGCARQAPQKADAGKAVRAKTASGANEAAAAKDSGFAKSAGSPETAVQPKLIAKPAEPSRAPGPHPSGGAGAQSALSANIDSKDPAYATQAPEIVADGRTVSVLYNPPPMFSVKVKAPGEKDERCSLTFATMTIVSDEGSDAEIHLLLREGSKPIKPIFRVRGSNIAKGRTWVKWCAGLNIKVKMLDFGRSGNTLTWIKVEITARRVS